jgi:hypothetical protein
MGRGVVVLRNSRPQLWKGIRLDAQDIASAYLCKEGAQRRGRNPWIRIDVSICLKECPRVHMQTPPVLPTICSYDPH